MRALSGEAGLSPCFNSKVQGTASIVKNKGYDINKKADKYSVSLQSASGLSTFNKKILRKSDAVKKYAYDDNNSIL